MRITPAPSPVSVPLMQRELWRGPELRAILGMRRSTFLKASQSGAIPAPVEIVGIRWWRSREIIDWLLAGAPDVKSEDWKWREVRTVNAKDYHTLLCKQITDAQSQLASIEQQIKLGDRIIELRRTS